MSLVVDAHRQYLSDAVRLSAFAAAIGEVVQPGDVVLDLGAGTGVLGLLACRSGARRVYAVDDGGVIEIARAIATANGCADRMVFVNSHSSEAEIPEAVDVLVCDLIGRFAIDGGIVEDVAVARDRFLKPDGRIVPATIDLEVAPVEYAEGARNIDFWMRRPAGLDMSPAREWAVNTGYPTAFAPDALVGAPARAARLDMATITSEPFAMHAALTVDRAAQLHGIGGWFHAQLSPGSELSNSPLAPARLHRRDVFFPIEHPVSVQPGDRIDVSFRVIAAETMISWAVDIGGRATFRHSTFKGMLASREELRRMHPRFAPSLTKRGVARLSVLALCDGARSVAEIEREVFERHRDLFSSPGEAGAFVAEVVTRYSR